MPEGIRFFGPVLRSAHIIFALALLLGVGPLADAQSAPERCADTLTAAEATYAAGEMAEAQALALGCAESGDTASAIRGLRLVALTRIRQGNIDDAQLAIVRILGADYDYQPDVDLDPPFFVALVETVREQLRVGPDDGAERLSPLPVRIAEVPIAPLPTMPIVPSADVVVPEIERPQERLGGRVNVNAASAADLQAVRGIGPALADRIVAHRIDHGPFRSAEELQDVRGIGPKSVQRLASQLAFGNVGAVTETVRPIARAATLTGPRINLNTATAEELDTLPGIGPALAGRIIAYREDEGQFGSVEDVLYVRGVGPKVLAGFAELVTVD